VSVASPFGRTIGEAVNVATSESTNDIPHDKNAMIRRARTPPKLTIPSTEHPPTALAILTTPEKLTKYEDVWESNTLAMNDQCCVDNNDT
jgi:hypothetical protein